MIDWESVYHQKCKVDEEAFNAIFDSIVDSIAADLWALSTTAVMKDNYDLKARVDLIRDEVKELKNKKKN